MSASARLGRLVRASGLRRLARGLFYLVEDLVGGSPARNEALRDACAGERCFVLGTGVSLDEVNFERLSGERVFACNLLFLHSDFHKLRVDFYAAIQHLLGFVYTRPRDFYGALDQACPDPGTVIFLRGLNRPYIEAKGFFAGRRKHYVRPGLPIGESTRPSHDLTGRVDFFDGAIYFMIAAAVFMGFREIVLVGCGYTYAPLSVFHFYDESALTPGFSFPWEKPRFPLALPKGERDRRIEAFARERGLVVHGRRVVGPDEVVRFAQNAPVSPAYEAVRALAERHGSEILNVVPAGFRSDVFRAVSPGDIFPGSAHP